MVGRDQQGKRTKKTLIKVNPMSEDLLLSRYKILSKLGSGGFSEVYKAFDTRMERVVAAKRIASGTKAAPRALREARTVALLNHPSIVTLYEFEETPDFYYLIMEFIEGITLQEVLAKKGQLTIDQSIVITTQICQALEYAHLNRIIHRDIKPENLMLLPDGRVKVMDFGIARLTDSSITKEGDIVGTLPYMSPEQCNAEYVDERTDLFSLGVVLYQMLTDISPFEAETAGAALFKILNTNPTPPSKINAGIPRGFNNAILKALAKEPDQRFENAAEMRARTARYKSSSASIKKILGPLLSPSLAESWTEENDITVESQGFRVRLFNSLEDYREILKRFFSSTLVAILSLSLLQAFPFYPNTLNILLPLILLFAVFLFPAAGTGLFFLSLLLPLFSFSLLTGVLFLILGSAYWFLFSRHKPHASLIPLMVPFLAKINIGIIFPIVIGIFFPPLAAMLLAGMGCLSLEVADIFGTASNQLHFLHINNSYHVLAANEVNGFQIVSLITRPFLEHPALIIQPLLWIAVALLVSIITFRRSPGKDITALISGATLLTLGYTWLLRQIGAIPVPFDQLMQGLSFSLIMLLIVLLCTPYGQLKKWRLGEVSAQRDEEEPESKNFRESA